MLSPVEPAALSGRIRRSECDGECAGECAGGRATSLPRLPTGVGVPVMLLMEWRAEGGGRGVRVQWWVVLRQ